MSCEIRAAEGDLGGTMRLGAYRAELAPGSKIAAHLWHDEHLRTAPASL